MLKKVDLLLDILYKKQITMKNKPLKDRIIFYLLIIIAPSFIICFLLSGIFKINKLSYLNIYLFIILWVLIVINLQNKPLPLFEAIKLIIFSYIVFMIVGFIVFYIFLYLNLHQIHIFIMPSLIILGLCIICCIITVNIFKNKFYIFLFTILFYITSILFSSLYFGIYYSVTFNINIHEITYLLNSKQYVAGAMNIVKIGMKYFYNYPDDNFCYVSIIQYFLGKLLDLFLLGYIFAKITEDKKLITK